MNEYMSVQHGVLPCVCLLVPGVSGRWEHGWPCSSVTCCVLTQKCMIRKIHCYFFLSPKPCRVLGDEECTILCHNLPQCFGISERSDFNLLHNLFPPVEWGTSVRPMGSFLTGLQFGILVNTYREIEKESVNWMVVKHKYWDVLIGKYLFPVLSFFCFTGCFLL